METDQRQSSARVRIVDQGRETVYAIDDVDGEVTVDLSTPDPTVRTSDGRTVDQLGRPSRDGGASMDASERVGRAGVPVRPPGHVALALLPLAVTTVGVCVGLLFGFEHFVPGRSPLGMAATYALLVPFFLVALAGTLWIYLDAARLADHPDRWAPNPWHYVVGGALVIEGYFVVAAVVAGPVTPDTVAALGGRFVVSLATASIVAGPVYLLHRSRRLDASS